jgi:hypothetical protein
MDPGPFGQPKVKRRGSEMPSVSGRLRRTGDGRRVEFLWYMWTKVKGLYVVRDGVGCRG